MQLPTSEHFTFQQQKDIQPQTPKKITPQQTTKKQLIDPSKHQSPKILNYQNTHSITPSYLLKLQNKRDLLPSIKNSKANIEATNKIDLIRKRTLNISELKKVKQKLIQQNIKQKNDQTVNVLKSPRSFQLTKNQKSLKQEYYLPAFIRNFQLPPRKKLQVIPTMEVFKKRQLQIKPFLSPVQDLKKYKILSHIGKGSFSIVSEGLNLQTNRKMAIKTYLKLDHIEDYKFLNILREVQNMFILANKKNIVYIESVIMQNRKLMLVMQNCGRQSLAGILRKRKTLTQFEAKNYLQQILQGISCFHQNNICHRDLKLENILVDDSNCVKIIDLGFSCSTARMLNSFCGTPPYMAPQIVGRKLYEGKATDIWSIGVVLYLMLYGNFPFKSNNENQLFRIIQQGKVQHNQSISLEARETINMMLDVNPLNRATSDSVLGTKWLNA